MGVDFITFCYYGDVEKLHAPGYLRGLVESNQYEFDNVIVVRQRCHGRIDPLPPFNLPSAVQIVDSEDHPNILTEFGIPEEDLLADEWTHGPTAPHYWKWHVINHLIGLKVSNADYVAFSDNDCRIIRTGHPSWIDMGIDLLTHYKEILVVSPSEGGQIADGGFRPGGVRLTQNNSQQIFLCERERLANIDFHVPWDWEFLAPWEPFQEYYYMLEGRIWRYMHHHHLYRAILPETWRYWHGEYRGELD